MRAAVCTRPDATLTKMYRRAKAIEQELYKRADGQASCAELAAVLQEWASPGRLVASAVLTLFHQVPRSLRGSDL